MSRFGFRLETSGWLILLVGVAFWLLANVALKDTYFHQIYQWTGPLSVDGVQLGMEPAGIEQILGPALPALPSSQDGRSLAVYNGLDGDRVDVFFTCGISTFVCGHSLFDGRTLVLRRGENMESMCHVLGSPPSPWFTWTLLPGPQRSGYTYPRLSLTVRVTPSLLSRRAQVTGFRLE